MRRAIDDESTLINSYSESFLTARNLTRRLGQKNQPNKFYVRLFTQHPATKIDSCYVDYASSQWEKVLTAMQSHSRRRHFWCVMYIQE